MSAREVTLGKNVQSGTLGSSDPRASFEQTYQLGKELGHGSFSTVREGTHKVRVFVRVRVVFLRARAQKKSHTCFVESYGM